MDLEQLKLVITSMEGVVGKLSDGAVLWLVLHYIVETVKALGWILVPTIIVTSIVRAIAGEGYYAVAWKAVAAQLGRPDSNPMHSSERAAVTKRVQDLLEREWEVQRLAKGDKK